MTLKYFSKKTGKEFHGFYSACQDSYILTPNI